MEQEKRLIFGFHPVTSLFQTRLKMDEILVLKGLEKNKLTRIQEMAEQKKIPLKIIENRKALDDLAGGENHQGVIASVKTDFQYIPLEQLESARLVVVLDHLTDPRNFGAILRSCDQFQIDGVIIPDARSCELNSTVLKTSSGAAFFVPVCRVPNLSQALEKLKQWGFWTYAAAGEEGESLPEVQFAPQTVLVLGSEGKGIAQKLKEKCDFKVSIPSQGHIDSLNVSVAAGILFYEAFLQLKKPQAL